MGIELSTEMLGVLSSVVAMAFSAIPFLGATTTRRSLVAIAVLTVGVLYEHAGQITTYQHFAELFGQSALYAFLTYKMFLQPIVKPTVDSFTASSTGDEKHS